MADQPRRDPAVEALEQRLGIPLSNADVALAALTHKSFVNEHRGEALQDNERLEFLGDAVLDLAVSHRLMERFPDAREGDLSKIRAAVVDEPGLALIARELDLGPLLRLGRGEELTGGREKSSLLADALEAVVAALYLGGGLEPVLTLIDRFVGAAFDRAAAGTLDRDYKTQLQELVQSRLRSAPRYRVAAEHGPDHSKIFDVELEIRGEIIARGAGRSKKDAEQAAAKYALDLFKAPPASPVELPAPGAADLAEAAAVAAPPVEPAVAESARESIEVRVEVAAESRERAASEGTAPGAPPRRRRAVKAVAGTRRPARKTDARGRTQRRTKKS